MVENKTSQHNPYVGPRPFERNDAAYFRGRDREVKELINLLIAERLVLVYSPSGAGKTSLIQAAVIPRLEKEMQAEEIDQESEGGKKATFRMWPVIRVGKYSSKDRPTVNNRYIFSMLKSLEEKFPEAALPNEKMAGMSLFQYQQSRPEIFDGHSYDIFIFDQFEEILTLDPTDLKVKTDFFTQLGEFLKVKERFALFATREEYLGGLHMYLHLIPTQLNTTFRLDLLGKEQALKAIREPAEEAGGHFDHKASEQLVMDLSTVKSSELGTKSGHVIEPVLLQVVCRGLWDNSAKGRIGAAEIKKFGDVTQALARYYRDKVNEVARKTAPDNKNEAISIERRIRYWFADGLITPRGIRRQVEREEGASSGLDNQLIAALVGAHLVREEQQRGGTWFELTHDRLIEPIRQDNEDWFTENLDWFKAGLNTFQQQSELWDRHGRPDGLLLSGEEVSKAKRWADIHQKEMTPAEQAFLASCLQKRRYSKILRLSTIISLIFGIACILAGLVASYYFYKLKEQARLSKARELSAAAVAELNLDPELSILLSLEALEVLGSRDGPVLNEVKDALQRSVHASRAKLTLQAHKGRGFDVAFSPDGKTMATASEDENETVKIWDVQTRKLLHTLPHYSGVWRVFFRPDGMQLLTLTQSGEAWLWDPQTGKELRHFIKDGNYVNVAAFSPHGNIVATGGKDGAVILWNPDTGKQIDSIVHPEAIIDVAFSPDGSRLATAGIDGLRVWNLTPPGDLLLHRRQGEFIQAVVFSPQGSRLASLNNNGVLEVHDLKSEKSWYAKVLNDALPVFSPDGEQVAVGDNRYKILLYDSTSGKLTKELSGHTNIVSQISYVEQNLFSCSTDGTSRLWDLSSGKDILIFRGHASPIERFAFNLKDRVLATTDWEGTVRVWDFSVLNSDWIFGWQLSPKGELLATVTRDQTLRVLDLASKRVLYSKSGLNPLCPPVFDPGGKLLAGSTGKEVKLWDSRTGKYMDSLSHLSEVENLSFSANSRYLATASKNGLVCIWEFDKDMNLSSYKSRYELVHSYGYVNGIAFSPDSEILATSGFDSIVRLWSVSTGKQLKQLPGHKSIVMSVSFSPDGSRLASASLDNTVKIWDLTPKQELLDSTVSDWTKELLTISRHNHGVGSVVYDWKGERLATTSRDLTVRIFDARSGKELVAYHFPHGVHSVEFSPDGTHLVIGGYHNELYFYPLDFSTLLEKAKGRLTRKLTETERRRFHLK